MKITPLQTNNGTWYEAIQVKYNSQGTPAEVLTGTAPTRIEAIENCLELVENINKNI